MLRRVHLNDRDLARTTLTSTLGPMAETALCLTMLYRREHGPLDGWRRDAARRLPRQLPFLHELYHADPVVDLVSLLTPATTFAENSEELLRHPGIDGELAWVARQRSLSSMVKDLATELAARGHLLGQLAMAHDTLLASHWHRIHALLLQEHGRRARDLLDGGLDRLLGAVSPRIVWRPPILEVDVQPVAGLPVNVVPGGRGLRVVPSVFCGTHAELYNPADTDQPLILLYPAIHEYSDAAAIWTDNPATPVGLDAVLGHTRGTILRIVGDRSAATGVEIAMAARVTPATVSEHLRLLREAGLVDMVRDGRAVRTTLTASGAALLNGDRRP